MAKCNDVEYLVFEKSGIIVCKIWNCMNIAVNKIRKHKSLQITERFSRYLINNVYVGMAKCSPEDEFDLEYGKRLALNRAKDKRNRAVSRAIGRYVNDMKRVLDSLYERR